MTRRIRQVKRYTVLLLLAVALLLSLPPVFHSVHASPRTIYLVGYSSSGWNLTISPQITVLPGETVTIVLSSGDGAPHQFLLDLDGDGESDQTNCPPMSSTNEDPCSSLFSSSSTSVTFTAPNSGTYNFYCTVHYPAMVGTLVVQPADFSISPSPSILTILAGSSANSTISLASQNGFKGNVSLTATITPTGPSTRLNTTSVSVPSGGSAASRLTISTTSATPSRSYTVTVTATNASLAHSTTVQVTVSSPPSMGPSPLTLPLALVGAAVVIVAVAGIAVFLMRKRTVSK